MLVAVQPAMFAYSHDHNHHRQPPMLTDPLWIAAEHWSRSIITRDNRWPVVDQPEMRPIERNTVDRARSVPRCRKDVQDGRR
jgi:hypothetical protein